MKPDEGLVLANTIQLFDALNREHHSGRVKLPAHLLESISEQRKAMLEMVTKPASDADSKSTAWKQVLKAAVGLGGDQLLLAEEAEGRVVEEPSLVPAPAKTTDPEAPGPAFREEIASDEKAKLDREAEVFSSHREPALAERVQIASGLPLEGEHLEALLSGARASYLLTGDAPHDNEAVKRAFEAYTKAGGDATFEDFAQQLADDAEAEDDLWWEENAHLLHPDAVAEAVMEKVAAQEEAHGQAEGNSPEIPESSPEEEPPEHLFDPRPVGAEVSLPEAPRPEHLSSERAEVYFALLLAITPSVGGGIPHADAVNAVAADLGLKKADVLRAFQELERAGTLWRPTQKQPWKRWRTGDPVQEWKERAPRGKAAEGNAPGSGSTGDTAAEGDPQGKPAPGADMTGAVAGGVTGETGKPDPGKPSQDIAPSNSSPDTPIARTGPPSDGGSGEPGKSSPPVSAPGGNGSTQGGAAAGGEVRPPWPKDVIGVPDPVRVEEIGMAILRGIKRNLSFGQLSMAVATELTAHPDHVKNTADSMGKAGIIFRPTTLSPWQICEPFLTLV